MPPFPKILRNPLSFRNIVMPLRCDFFNQAAWLIASNVLNVMFENTKIECGMMHFKKASLYTAVSTLY